MTSISAGTNPLTRIHPNRAKTWSTTSTVLALGCFCTDIFTPCAPSRRTRTRSSSWESETTATSDKEILSPLGRRTGKAASAATLLTRPAIRLPISWSSMCTRPPGAS